MYYHQVIEYVEKSLLTRNSEEYDKYYQFVIHRLEKAQRFYLGDVENMATVVGITSDSSFGGYDDVRPPYPITYLDFCAPTQGKPEPGVYQWTKGAVVIAEEHEQYIAFCFFYVPEIKNWFHDNHFIVADLETETDGVFDHTFQQISQHDADKIFKESGTHTMALCCLQRLLKCKNISPKDVEPASRLNRRRGKRKRRPLLSYKVLMVDSVGSSGRSKGSGVARGSMPLSMTRGHFKTYTQEKPLFGKYHGDFWWQPTIKGNAKNGVIKKRYDVTRLVDKRSEI